MSEQVWEILIPYLRIWITVLVFAKNMRGVFNLSTWHLYVNVDARGKCLSTQEAGAGWRVSRSRIQLLHPDVTHFVRRRILCAQLFRLAGIWFIYTNCWLLLNFASGWSCQNSEFQKKYLSLVVTCCFVDLHILSAVVQFRVGAILIKIAMFEKRSLTFILHERNLDKMYSILSTELNLFQNSELVWLIDSVQLFTWVLITRM